MTNLLPMCSIHDNQIRLADKLTFTAQRRDCQDMLTIYGPDFKPVTRFATDTSDLADLVVSPAFSIAVPALQPCGVKARACVPKRLLTALAFCCINRFKLTASQADNITSLAACDNLHPHSLAVVA